MITVQAGGEIARPADEVFDFIANFENNPIWQQGMRSARWTSVPPIHVGSTYEQVARFLGRDVVSSFEVIAYTPGRRITIATRRGSFPITVTRSVEPIDAQHCRVQANIEGDASGFFRLAKPVLQRLVERSIRGDYRRLKTILEARRALP
jgi:uncharacterized membrane protein